MVGAALARAAAAVLVSVAPGGLAAGAHPLHTTLTEITFDASRRTMRAVVRVFADDVGNALSKRRGGTPPSTSPSDADAAGYVLSQFVVMDGSARRVASRACGVERRGDLLWVCAEADVDPRSASLKDSVLCELYSDQVNIVQVTSTGTSRSILFTRGDGAKKLL